MCLIISSLPNYWWILPEVNINKYWVLSALDGVVHEKMMQKFHYRDSNPGILRERQV
jgi:hypothetical protein